MEKLGYLMVIRPCTKIVKSEQILDYPPTIGLKDGIARTF